MQFKVYSTEPLPLSLRGTFELPAWPYYNGNAKDIPKELIDYFKKYKIVHYQDDYVKFPSGIVIDPPQTPFIAFLSSGWVDDSDLKIIEWPMNAPPGMSVNYRLQEKINKKTGDNWAWGEFNSIYQIDSVSPQRVKLTRLGKEEKAEIIRRLGW